MQRHMPLGYQMLGGKVEIVPETGKIVKGIFNAYLEGTSICQIAKGLTKLGVLNASQKPLWNHCSVGKILENRKYIGDSFYPQLITEDVFRRVQERREEKAVSLGRGLQLNSFGNQTIYQNKIVCGICGQPYRRYVEHSKQPSQSIKWKCKHYIKNNRVSCRNVFLTDEEIEQAFLKIINYVINHPECLINKRVPKCIMANSKVEVIKQQIQKTLLTGEYNAETIKQMIYKKASIQYENSSIDDSAYREEKLKKVLAGKKRQIIFDETLFEQTIEKVIVQQEGILQFELVNGLRLESRIRQNEKKEVST